MIEIGWAYVEKRLNRNLEKAYLMAVLIADWAYWGKEADWNSIV